jgi:hypothetical protein
MASNLYALLVGINDYSPNVGKLNGCLNDVDHFHDYLTDNFDRSGLLIEVLKDADATRSNIIEQFRSHLGKAKRDDTVFFQYCEIHLYKKQDGMSPQDVRAAVARRSALSFHVIPF